MFDYGDYWASTESAYALVASLMLRVASNPQMMQTEKQLPSLLSISDGVGIISIEGSLIPGNAGWMTYFGVTGYNDVSEAAVAAANNGDVKSVLLDVNSGGGAVNGCSECAEILVQLGSVKPMVTYSGGVMASAAYWLGAQGQAVLTGATSILGSIGVIAKHTEMSKMRADLGYKDTVIRSGIYKQLANDVEPLSALAVQEIQAKVDQIALVFDQNISAARGVSLAKFQAEMGQGREFVGAQAVKSGLADGLSSYSGAIAAAKAMQSR